MPAEQIDTYLASLEEPKRSTLAKLRETILEVVPNAEQGLSYGVPVFRIDGKNIAGFSAAKGHLSYLPHSGTVLTSVEGDVVDYETSKGALKFGVDTPLPRKIVKKLIAARRLELQNRGRKK